MKGQVDMVDVEEEVAMAQLVALTEARSAVDKAVVATAPAALVA